MIFDGQGDASSFGIQGFKQDRSPVLRAVYALPDNSCIRHLLENFCLPFFVFPCDVNFPEESSRTMLSDFPHSFHEARKLFKLGPLVVHRSERGVDFE